MLTQFDLTQTIGLIIAIYMITAGIGLVTDSKGFASLMDDFIDNLALTYLGAMMAFFVGATLVAIHSLWSTPLEIIVSLVGWASAVEGVLMLAFRRPFFTLVGAIPMNTGFVKAYGAFIIALGAIVLFLVFGR